MKGKRGPAQLMSAPGQHEPACSLLREGLPEGKSWLSSRQGKIYGGF